MIINSFVGCVELSISQEECWKVSTSVSSDVKDVEYIKIALSSIGEAQKPPQITLSWRVDSKGIDFLWHPLSRMSKHIRPNWGFSMDTSLSCGAPIVLYGNNHENLNCFSFAVSEARRKVTIKTGVNEISSNMDVSVVLFSEPEAPISEYEVTLRLDKRNIFYTNVINDIASWYETFPESTPVEIPSIAYKPVFSTWYNYHQNISANNIAEECKIASQLGMKTVIVDDGWQTDDTGLLYSYCGDWEISKEKFPDMENHVKEVHAHGMKYIMWFSVAFVGELSKVRERFEGKFLYSRDELRAFVLDPRFPEVREYLYDVFENAVIKWGIDGLKLDFIDSFFFSGEDPAIAESYKGRDIRSLSIAVNVLMVGIIERLRKINPDILIEFRQAYIGPVMRSFGNMFRVSDCPMDYLSNRVGSVDLRLSSRNTAVHSDMIMWAKNDSVEQAALQMLNILFSAPQISVKLTDISEDYMKMLKFWLDFCSEHEEVLLHSDFIPLYPQSLYPVIIAKNSASAIIATYSNDMVLDVDSYTSECKEIYVVNATTSEKCFIKSSRDFEVVLVCDTMGNSREIKVDRGVVSSIDVPRSGLIKVIR